MKLSQLAALACLAVVPLLALADTGKTKVELKGVHLCCGACTTAVGKILKTVDGVAGKCDAKAGTVTITAKDDDTAAKAVAALAAGGFYGESSNPKLAIKDESGATAGKVKSVTVSGIHNCCGSCCKAIKSAVKKVDGVTGDTAKPKATTFEVTGDFDAVELVKALHAAGFNVKLSK
jgi:copper chaperone CopZ